MQIKGNPLSELLRRIPIETLLQIKNVSLIITYETGTTFLTREICILFQKALLLHHVQIYKMEDKTIKTHQAHCPVEI